MARLHFTPDHEWLRVDADVATVGSTGHAQHALGDIVFVQLPEVGAHFAAGAEAAVLESVKAAGAIHLPVAGAVVEVHSAVVSAPGSANRDPMGDGWFLRIRPDAAANRSGLLEHEQRHEARDLERGLKNRRIQLIAISGAIGVGLFQGSARAIHQAGPTLLLTCAIAGVALYVVAVWFGFLPVLRRLSGTHGRQRIALAQVAR